MAHSPPDYFFWVVAVLWGCIALIGVRDALTMRLLPARRQGVRPTVSVVVAARDEEARIETTVLRLLAQVGVELEIIVVDDRSRDRTGEILRGLATKYPGLRVVRVDDLPAGWLGKCHACHVGSGLASGEWVLFADGDVWLRDDVVVRAVGQADAEAADHVTLVPWVRGATFLGSVVQLLLGIVFGRRAGAVNRDRPGSYFGIGAFNLVRAEAYRVIGGHVPLRMEVVDDLKLALLLRKAGRRSRVFFSAGDADADWCPGALGVVRGMEKNHFAATGYRLSRVLLGAAMLGLFWVSAVAGPWTGSVGGLAAGLALMSMSLPAAIAAVRLGWPIAAAPLVPLFVPVLAVSLVHSAVVTLRRGGVRWRDTFYPLAELRAGSVR